MTATLPAIVVTGAAHRVLRPADVDPPSALARARSLTRSTVAVAAEALATAVLDRSVDVGAAFGTSTAPLLVTGHLLDTLDGPGPRFIDPEAFLFNNTNAVAAVFATDNGTTGPTISLAGDDAGTQALDVGVRLLASGRCAAVVAGAFDWPVGPDHHPGAAGQGAAAFVVLERAEDASARSATVVAPWPVIAAFDPRIAPDVPVGHRAVAPVLRLVASLVRNGFEAT